MNGHCRRVTRALVLVTAVAGAIWAVPARPAEAATKKVELEKMRFNPARLQISPGDTVVWEAEDDSHTVTARDGTFDSSTRGTMDEGDQFRWRFRAPGKYAYYCRVHQNRGMQGEIVVVDPSTTSTRLTPVTAAPASTSTTAVATTETTMETTTTTRELATSSTTSLRQAISTPEPDGAPLTPQEPPALNPNAPVLSGGNAVLPEAQAASRRDAEEEGGLGPAIALGVVGGLLVAGGGAAALRARGRRSRRNPTP